MKQVIALALCLSGIASAAGTVPSFAPSPARMVDGRLADAENVATSSSCGHSGCHPDVAAQWASSAHHFSSFNNPYYRKAVERLMDEPDGVAKSRWCAGCHDPALLLSGEMQQRPDPEHPLAAEGVGCMLCHAVAPHEDPRGNGGYAIERIDPVPLDDRGGLLPALGRALLEMRSAPHAEMLLRPHVRSAELCRACHKVSVPPEINGTRWRRGQNEYDRWHDSGVSGHNDLSFFLRRKPLDCIDCHMPEVASNDEGNDEGQIASHRFAAANTALPFLRGDTDQLREVEESLRRGAMRISLAALSDPSIDELRDVAEFTPRAGDEVRLYVVARNANVGHAFPGGTIDSHEAWIEFRLWDASGRTLLRSGVTDSVSSVPPNTRVYRGRLLDADGRTLMKREVQHWVATGYTNTIGPGAADVARYRLRLPSDVQFPLSWSARLLYRKFNPTISAFVFDGRIPALPITEIAHDQGTIGRVRSEDAQTIADRWNDLGIALFLQEDRRRARDCFQRATARQPERSDLWLNQARVALEDGDLPLAAELLERAAEREADHPTGKRLSARLAAVEGDYERAISLLRALRDDDPQSRGTWADLAEAYYFSGDFAAALESYQAILEIDPESLLAHNGRLLSLRALGHDFGEAADAVARYKVAESEFAIAGRWLRAHPEENQAAQRIWEYRVEETP